MARSLFAGGVGDQVFGEILLGQRTVYGEVTDSNGDPAAVTLTVWSAKTGGTQLTDLLDAAGAAATTVVTSVGDGLIPQFQGPDAVTTVWVSADEGVTRFRLFAATAGGGGGSGDVVGPASSVSGNLPSFSGTTGKLLQDSGLAASAIALTSSPLSQFAATTSAQLRGVLSDETGTGAAVFATSPTLVTPALGTPSSLTLTNATGLPASGIGSGTIATARLGAGTADGSTILRGSQTWSPLNAIDVEEALVGQSSDSGSPGDTFLVDGSGNWQLAPPAGGGDVVGPASATDDRIATFDGTTGKLVQDGGQTVAGVLARANHTGTQTLATISDVTASAAELNFTDGVTSAIQTQLDGKQATDGDLTAIAALTPTNDDVIQRKAGAWTNRTMAQVKTDLALTKTDVGLANVDNTSDATKNAASVTLTNKTLTAPVIATISNTGTLTLPTSTDTLVGRATTDTLTNKTLTAPAISSPTGLVKGDVGLGNVDNTSDANKPVSTATQTALDAKVDEARTINAQTGTTYTLVAGDIGKFVTMSNASASTLTVPPNSSVAFAVGTVIEGAQLGAGQVTLTQGAGVTINATPGLKIAAQYGSFALIKTATDVWLAMGRLSA